MGRALGYDEADEIGRNIIVFNQFFSVVVDRILIKFSCRIIQGLPSLNVGTSHSYRGPQMEQLLPLRLFLGSQKFKYLGTPVMNLDDFFFVVFRYNMRIFFVIKFFFCDLRIMFFSMRVIDKKIV